MAHCGSKITQRYWLQALHPHADCNFETCCLNDEGPQENPRKTSRQVSHPCMTFSPPAGRAHIASAVNVGPAPTHSACTMLVRDRRCHRTRASPALTHPSKEPRHRRTRGGLSSSHFRNHPALVQGTACGLSLLRTLSRALSLHGGIESCAPGWGPSSKLLATFLRTLFANPDAMRGRVRARG
ncbi:hypothetical protein L226DRAFT_268793 [Lentinus tigrinus ALCF2SS1-7]|uniref:Uncharacterized protein n=1 Tax=Lentinus tigrinus ALCF2SS1-6 TaxID=1328759 RepID=A0A5C2RS60_9APHY|nr:hypothetical protein L227DRAFT_350142 [Lentinus tigrinus ALCF2SS1-6]RPD69608.1 hypothetical protein L226DRAFT_268793 [Lentinus tigrinus ALCF2SS1-7]